MEEIDLKISLFAVCIIDKSREVEENLTSFDKQDILDFEAEHGKIPEGSFVAFRSDWSSVGKTYEET